VVDKKRLKLLGRLARGRILDVGCHDVQNPYLTRVTGFDLKYPETLLPNYSEFIQGDCQAIDSYFGEKSFDTIVAGELIEHLESPASFLRGCRRVLKDEGQLLITTPNPYHWTTAIGNLFFIRSGLVRDHINFFPFRTLLALLEHTGWECKNVKNASGMRLWHNTRKYFIPCPKSLAWQHLYTCCKKEPVCGLK
jgi:SAM-dependent methyltransferase